MVGAWASMASSFVRNRALILRMTEREVVGRYRGSVLGLAWSFLHPLLMLAIYTFFFSVVFKARWNVPGTESRSTFAILLFIGLIVHGLFAECISKAPGLVVGNTNYVKKVVFPLEILSFVTVASALFHAAISLIAMLLVQLFAFGSVPATALLFPLVILPLLLFTIGACWLLSSLGVFVRDIGQAMGLLVTVLLFLSPVFYPISSLPPAYQPWFQLNPLTPIIEDARAVLVFGQGFDATQWLLRMAVSCVIAVAGYWWFQKTRKGFADVL
jgi:lipopolysaccharide transport system permease protein